MLPAPLARERDRVECMSFMGLLPEIDHAWMTVDNVLFLWNYHTQDFTQYRELKQVRSYLPRMTRCTQLLGDDFLGRRNILLGGITHEGEGVGITSPLGRMTIRRTFSEVHAFERMLNLTPTPAQLLPRSVGRRG